MTSYIKFFGYFLVFRFEKIIPTAYYKNWDAICDSSEQLWAMKKSTVE